MALALIAVLVIGPRVPEVGVGLPQEVGVEHWAAYPAAVMSPAPAPPPPTHYLGIGQGCASGYVHDLIVSYDWNDAEALGIASRESGCNPYAKNPISSASGVFQLVSTWWAGKFDPFDAAANIAQAYSMWSADGGSFCPGQWCV